MVKFLCDLPAISMLLGNYQENTMALIRLAWISLPLYMWTSQTSHTYPVASRKKNTKIAVIWPHCVWWPLHSYLPPGRPFHLEHGSFHSFLPSSPSHESRSLCLTTPASLSWVHMVRGAHKTVGVPGGSFSPLWWGTPGWRQPAFVKHRQASHKLLQCPDWVEAPVWYLFWESPGEWESSILKKEPMSQDLQE